jgi:hypothetical protein
MTSSRFLGAEKVKVFKDPLLHFIRSLVGEGDCVYALKVERFLRLQAE